MALLFYSIFKRSQPSLIDRLTLLFTKWHFWQDPPGVWKQHVSSTASCGSSLSRADIITLSSLASFLRVQKLTNHETRSSVSYRVILLWQETETTDGLGCKPLYPWHIATVTWPLAGLHFTALVVSRPCGRCFHIVLKWECGPFSYFILTTV